MLRRCLSLLLLVVLPAAADPLSAQSLPDAIRLVQTERFTEARPLLLQLASREPNNVEVAYWTGRTLVALGEADGAARHLERAVQGAANNAEYQLWLGRAYGLQAQRAGTLRQPGLARKTKTAFERVVALDPDNLDARAHLIDFHLQAPGIMGGSKQTALQQAQEIRRRNVYRGLQELARVQHALDQPAQAEQSLRTLVSSFPDSAGARVGLALHYQNAQRWDEARDALRPLVTARTRTGLYQMGRLAAVSGRFLDEGEAGLRAWLAGTRGNGEPAPAAGHWRLGMVLQHRGDTAGARQQYEAALRLEPDHQQARDALRKLR